MICAGALAGCSLGPEYFTPDAALPVNFTVPPAGNGPQSGGASPDLWQWWRTLRDPQLNDLIDRAIQNNLDLKIALDRLQQARLQLIVIGAQAVPQLNGGVGGGTGTGTDETKGRAAQALRDGDNNTGLKKISGIGGLDAEWEIDIFGKIARRVEAQVYTAEALKEARDWVYVVMAADVARLYFDLRARQERLQILYRDIEASRKVLDLAQTRLDRGLTNELDVLLAKRQVETLQADVEPLKALIAANGYAIAVLVGEYPEAIARDLRRPGACPAAAAARTGWNSRRSLAPPPRHPRSRTLSRGRCRRYRRADCGPVPQRGRHGWRRCADRSKIGLRYSDHLDRIGGPNPRCSDPRLRRARCQDRDCRLPGA